MSEKQFLNYTSEVIKSSHQTKQLDTYGLDTTSSPKISRH